VINQEGGSLYQLPFSWRVVCLQLVAASAASDKAVDAHTNGTAYIRIQPPPGHWQQTGIRYFPPLQSFSFFLRTSSTSMPSLYAPVLLLLLEVADGRGGSDELVALLTRRLQALRCPAFWEKRNVVGLSSLGLLQQLSPCQPYSPPPTLDVIRGSVGVVDESLGILAANRHHVSVVELIEPDYDGPPHRSETRAGRRRAENRSVVVARGALETVVFITSWEGLAQWEYSL
jgi:hypothetical protein